jgi:hypothetical protein
MRLRAALIGAFLAAVVSGPAFGQGFQGGLRGSLKDAGGVLPGAEVTLTNEQTNISRSTVTNERGEYVFTNVDPATYKLKATLQGYKTVDQSGIRIGTQQFLTMDLTMEVGRIEENVTVTGSAPIIETSNASRGTDLDSQTLQTLPAPGRNAFMVGTSVPTVIPSGDAQFNRQQDQTNASLTSLGGGTRRGNNYTLDGVPITDMQGRMSANPTIEALDDVKVQVHTYDAEMGRTGGGVFNTTLKSGSNDFHGSAFFQNRPVWSQENNYFSNIANIPKPSSPYYLGGGSYGGPIVKNRTFFWFATEDYHDISTRNIGVTMPTAAERAGDFSGLLNSKGQSVIIYNPLTHQPFLGNIIPSNMINPVAANMLKYLPLPNTGNTAIDNGTINYNIASTIDDIFQQEYTFKVEHKFTDKTSLSGFFLYNRTNEPCADYFFQGQSGPNRFADPNNYILARRPKILALNNTWVLSDTSVMSLRFGMTRFPDNNTLSSTFDPTSLGFAPIYGTEINPAYAKFPYVDVQNYDQQGRTLGAINPTSINWKSVSANGAYSKFVGTHTFKVGADFRKLGIDTYIPGNSNGVFTFTPEFTSSTGTNASDPLSGNAFASYLLGYPSGNSNSLAALTTTTAANIYTYYFGGYAQDDWRVNSKLTVNYGLRLERENGVAEQNNAFSVGFNPTATTSNSIFNVTIPADPIAGTSARTVAGGLLYAGVNGNPTTQGNPPKVKASPRVGLVYSLDSKTVIRGGYGLFWAPYNYVAPSPTSNNYGQDGYTFNTSSPQTAGTPTVSLTNPFPTGVLQPVGNTLGAATGAGQTIAFVDQNRGAPRVQQYSVDFQRELGHDMAFQVSYVGSRGDNLGLGGSAGVAAVNINMLDPKYLALGSATLTQAVPNPFFGIVTTGPLAAATIPRWRLLVPYPQYQQVQDDQLTEGISRYNAAIVEWTKRVTHGWGGRISYTYSHLMDNQWGETNFYSNDSALPLNPYNYNPYAPACTGNNNAACYNPMAEYSTSLLDVPHRLIIAPIVELPFGKGKRWGNESRMADLLVGGWVFAMVGNFQSGFPINLQQSDNTGGILAGYAQRPNIVSGVAPNCSGDYAACLASADHPAATWVNPAAFSLVPSLATCITGGVSNCFGNTPRTLTTVRTPTQENVDLSMMKNLRVAGTRTIQLKFEVLNLFNRVTMRGNTTSNNLSSSTFEQWNQQSGFQRMLQFMARFQF